MGQGAAFVALLGVVLAVSIGLGRYGERNQFTRIVLPQPFAVSIEDVSDATEPVDPALPLASEAVAADYAGEADIAQAATPPSEPPVPPAKPPVDMMSLKFDLAAFGSNAVETGGSEITVHKPIRMSGRRLGNAEIHVNRHSQLMISESALARLLSSAGINHALDPQAGRGAFISFSAARDQGYDLRYDPLTDTIDMTII